LLESGSNGIETMSLPPGDPADARRILREHDLLGAIDPSDLDELLARAHSRQYADGTLLFQKGDPGDRLFVVQVGGVKVFVLSDTGREILLNVMAAGEVFGEIALLDGNPRTAAAATVGATRLLEIQRRDVLPLVLERPELALRMIQILCARLRWVSEAYEDSMLLHFPQRLAKKLLVLAKTLGEPVNRRDRIDIQVSQKDLGNMLGVSRQVVNKQLSKWQADGVVSAYRGHLVLEVMGSLEEIASPPTSKIE